VKLGTARLDGGKAAVRIDGDEAIRLPHASLGELLASGPGWKERAAQADGTRHPLADLDFEIPVENPEKVICAGLNYRDHVLESGRELPEYPTLFAKFGRCLIGARDEIAIPLNSDRVDWEGELGVVIGEPLRHADADQAREAIAGYTVANDVSMRDWQVRTSEMLQGKAFERSTPVGPWIVTGDEIDDAADLKLSCVVDGTVMQDGSTADMIFGPAELAAYISSFITLMPGDLLLTGTPKGIGAVRKPPIYLEPGKIVETRIEGIGEMVNACGKAT
jgi:acylpyruvate hydrolase